MIFPSARTPVPCLSRWPEMKHLLLISHAKRGVYRIQFSASFLQVSSCQRP